MIDRSLQWAYGEDFATQTKKLQNGAMVDVGCGVGGSSRHIAKKFGCKATGLSLSPYQIERAKGFTMQEGLSDRVNYLVADAMKMPFPENSFDLVWSMESGE
jgi:tocopherol O-methyltransferase